MTRKRTIGENPLDQNPSDVTTAPAEIEGQAGDGAAAAGLAPAGLGSGSARRAAYEAASAATAKVSALSRKAASGLLQSQAITVVSGESSTLETQLSRDSDGRCGFRLSEAEFVAAGRDLARIDLVPSDKGEGAWRMLLWGGVGAFIAGPVGALAGGVFGGRRLHRVTARLHLKDGRTLSVKTQMPVVESMRKEVELAQRLGEVSAEPK